MDTPLATPAPACPPKATPLAHVPGPRPWPLLGNLPQVDGRRLHAQLEDWVATYGPVYRMRLGRRDTLVVARAELISALGRDRPEGWRRLRSMQTVIGEMGAHGLFSAEGEDWRRQRRLVMKAFDPAHVRQFFPVIARATERLHACLDTIARGGEAIDLQALLMRYTVDVTTGLAFGADLNTLAHPDNALQGHLDHVFPMLMKRIFAPLPWWRYVRLPSDRAFDRHLAKVHEAIGEFVEQARARMRRDPALQQRPSNLLEALIAARDEEGGGLSEESLVGNVLTVLLAGEDTTANTLCWTLHLLHTHRADWDGLVGAVDAALGAVDVPRDFDRLRDLQAIEHAVNEAMRLHPVGPVGLFECNRDTNFAGVALPEGSAVMCLMRPGAVDTTLAADAAAFRPGRWRDAATAPDDDPGRRLLKSSMPFGSGARMCPGRYLAMLEMKMVLATIARDFELVEVATADGTPPQERLAFTMFPLGLRLRLARRRPDVPAGSSCNGETRVDAGGRAL